MDGSREPVTAAATARPADSEGSIAAGMIYGVSTYLCIEGRVTTSWLEDARRAGAEIVELFCARQSFDYRDPGRVSELARWFRDSTLRLHSLHAPVYSDTERGRSGPHTTVNLADVERIWRRDSVDEIKRSLEVAETLPFRYLVQHAGVKGESYDERKVEALFRSIEELNVFAHDRGVEILIENTPNELSTATRLAEFVEQTHLENGFCLDTGHAHLAETVESAFGILRDRIRSTHIHDNDGSEDQHLRPGAGGAIPWPRGMELLRSRGQQYPLVLELRSSEAEKPDCAIGRAIEFLEGQ